MWKVEVYSESRAQWRSDDRLFDTEEQARIYGADAYSRVAVVGGHVAVGEWRVVEC